MSYRRQIEREPETLQELELASERRYYEALELLIVGQPAGGVYLLGYVAEMLLKVAYLRYAGARIADLVLPRLGPTRRLGDLLIPGVRHEGYHSLRFWALLLSERRRWDARPLTPELGNALIQRSRRAYQAWSVESRYRSASPDDQTARSLLSDVEWFRANYRTLWR